MSDTHDTTRGGTNPVTDALYRIERLEDRLHARDDQLADDISALRRMVARRLMDDDKPLPDLDELEPVTGGGVDQDDGEVDHRVSENILDATTGGKGIWFEDQKENDRTLFIDKRETEPGDIGQPNRYYAVQPDEVQDFRDLPYESGSFDLVVFDPPHVTRKNGMESLKGHMTKKYGALHAETWQDDLRRGFIELFRVLRPGGTLVFKFADNAADFEEVLRLAPEPPLFGTRTKKTNTENRFFVFHKPRDGGEAGGE